MTAPGSRATVVFAMRAETVHAAERFEMRPVTWLMSSAYPSAVMSLVLAVVSTNACASVTSGISSNAKVKRPLVMAPVMVVLMPDSIAWKLVTAVAPTPVAVPTTWIQFHGRTSAMRFDVAVARSASAKLGPTDSHE